MIDNNFEKKEYKVILYGDNYVGTTSLLRKYIYGTFDPYFYAYQSYFLGKEVKLNNKKSVFVHFCDLYHSYNYESLNKIFFKGADGFILTYDITKTRTFDTMIELLNQVIDSFKEEEVPIALVACKIDLFYDEEITREEGENFAEQNGLLFYETSAKSGLKVDFCFNDFINLIIPQNINNNIINLKKERPPKRGCLK